MHTLVQRIARARLEVDEMVAGRSDARKSRDSKLAQHVGYIRRRLSFTAVQQQAGLLLDRLGLLWDGVGEAARRRDWAVQLENLAARERRAKAVCLRQGRPLIRRGCSTAV